MKITAILINKFLSPRPRIKLALLLVLVAITLTLLVCFSSSESPEFEFMRDAKVEVSCKDFRAYPNYSGSVQLHVGGTLTVILCSNRTTGYLWSESAQISDQTVLQQINHEYERPTSDQVGAAGKEVWTFKTLKKGKSTIYLEYSRPWEGHEKAHWTFRLTVVAE